jgi:hypothetical protein
MNFCPIGRDQSSGWGHTKGFRMGKIVGLLGLAALVLVGIFTVSPRATVTMNAASTDIVGIDILGLTKSAKDLPVQQFAAH